MSDALAPARDVLNTVFGFSAFRPGQAPVIAEILAGRHALAVMPTGAGKSLCYQIPALLADRPTVVVSPLTALMDDQAAGLEGYGAAAARIHSGRLREDNVADWRRVQAGEARIVYMSPERLMTPRMLEALDRMRPAHFIIDEAHCISKWGADFRPEYDQLSMLCDRFPDAVIAGFTATADRATRADIAEKLFRGRGSVFVEGFDRPNLRLMAQPRHHLHDQLTAFIAERRGQSGIVYCLARKRTEEVANFLNAAGVDAIAYHAGQPPAARAAAQDRFMTDAGVVMVATIAFGMGIDKPDIRFVVHTDLPGSMEAFYQEIGRAGRDGEPADTLLLYGGDDLRLRRMMIAEGGRSEEGRRRDEIRLDALYAYAQASGCRRRALLAYFDEEGEACGNCDNCLDPPRMEDASAAFTMVARAIQETGARFGKSHIVDLLRGAETSKIKAHGHDALGCYGGGTDHPTRWWRELIAQALAEGRLTMDMDAYGALKLTPAGRAVVEGTAAFAIRLAVVPRKPESRQPAATPVEGADGAMLNALKAKRLELAHARGAPAYTVFPDATLIEMARRRPTNDADLLAINGIGPKKLADYGAAFLAVLAEAG